MKIAFCIPYFVVGGGKFPNNFAYWLRSAAANAAIDFFIATNVDVSAYEKYDNVHYIFMTIEQWWGKLEELLHFNVARTPYKTGEERAFVGLLFKDILQDYDYWGYTEFDLVYGDILRFIQPYLDKGEPVIGRFGHFRLIRNTDEMRRMPFSKIRDMEHPLTLERAFSEDACWYFEEIRGMGIIYYQAGIPVRVLDDFVADIDPKYEYMSCFGKSGAWSFVWRNGKLVGHNERGEEREFLYAHFQKRALQVSGDELPQAVFSIVPNVILNGEESKSVLKPNSSLYVWRSRLRSYKAAQRWQRGLDKEDRMVIVESNAYLKRVGLITLPPVNNPLKKAYKTLLNRVLWFRTY